jgi:type I restriction enzyme S subunit
MGEPNPRKLRDVINLKRGYDLPRQKRQPGKIPIVSSSGITDYHAVAKVKGPGVVTGRYGTLGDVFFIEGDFWPLNTSLYVQDFKGNDPRFISYFLRSLDLGSRNAAGAVPGVNRNHLHEIDVVVPPLADQRRIAAILSAYDNLIENNLRRIKILEEMARALYREWFIEFRFPGHTEFPRVASVVGLIPEGWEVKFLGDILTSLETGTRPKGGIRDCVDGVPSIGAENIDGIGRHKFNNEKYVSREFFGNMRRGIVRDRDVAIYKDGAYIGKTTYFRDGFPYSECCVNEHVFLLRPDACLPQNFLYLWLQDAETVHAIRATNANAAQPGINQSGVNGLKIALPDPAIIKEFDRIIEPLLAHIINLAKSNQNLRHTRDLLLPRLLSGQVPAAAAALSA